MIPVLAGSDNRRRVRILNGVGAVWKAALSHPAPLVIFLLAAGLRFLLLDESISQIGAAKLLETPPDTNLYVNMAKDLLAGTRYFENGFFYFGFGYAVFLAFFFVIFGVKALPVLITQILLSSLACVMLYRLAMSLTKSRAVGVLTGILAAVSYTSISLACLALSDSIFFFVFLCGLVTYIKGLETGRWRYFIVTGFLVGAAVLTSISSSEMAGRSILPRSSLTTSTCPSDPEWILMVHFARMPTSLVKDISEVA